jgi:NAD+-dependent protein deacetylase sirtuin 4
VTAPLSQLPPHRPDRDKVERLVDLLRGRRILALTGAGCSTGSGIPDYRGPGTARRARNPIQLNEFLRSPEGRQRYWARGMLGWPRVRDAQPNAVHLALAALEAKGLLVGVVTQNIDRLHQAAGSQQVVELHGALAEVGCLACGATEGRENLQHRLLTLNPHWLDHGAELAPDGDAEIDLAVTRSFRVADCLSCGGVLKPRVVYFGENVAPDRVATAWEMQARAQVLLVVGSSLTVFSGFRFVRQAHKDGLPVAIVNLGPTRGDPLATLRIDAAAGPVLGCVARCLVES